MQLLIADALFYGSALGTGGPVSSPNILTTGNIAWSGPTGSAAGVATDQQGVGTAYQFFWPCCGGTDTNFFQDIPAGLSGTGEYIGRTFGLLQTSNGLPTPDPQWPFETGANFAVNPVNSSDVVISSNDGRIFATSDQGVSWFDIGDPADFGSPGSFSVALAYGAADPNAPEGVGNLGNFIYVGTQTGQIYVTQDGGGSGSSNNWINISAGLDGSPVESIVTDPARGSHEAYAVTTTGVFFMPDSIPSATNPSPTWVSISGNILNLAYSIFGQTYNPTADPNPITLNQAVTLSSIVADWRYQIPINPSDPAAGTYPVLYVGAGGSGSNGSGVYQSTDNGATWTLFPDTGYGAVAEGGDLPHVPVTSLSTSLGDINSSTGMPTLAGPDEAFVFVANLTDHQATVTNINSFNGLAVGDTVSGTGIVAGTTITAVNTAGGTITLSNAATMSLSSATIAAADPTLVADPDLLMAATFGEGEFAINLTPLILGAPGDQVSVAPTAPGVGSNPRYVGAPITISGTSEVSAFGNTTWITVEDITNPADPIVIAGYNPNDPIPVPSALNSTNASGSFSFNWNPATLYGTTPGIKSIEIFATDNAGAVGNKVIDQFDWDPATQLVFATTGEPPATAEPGDNFATPLPIIVDAEDMSGSIATTYTGPVTISLATGTGLTGTLTVDAVAGVATFSSLMIADDGTYNLDAASPGLTSAAGLNESTSIYIVGAAASLYIVPGQGPPSSVEAGSTWGFIVGADDAFGNPTPIFSGNVTVAMGMNPGGSNPSGVSETVPVVTVPGVGSFATFSGLTLNKVNPVVGMAYTLDVTSGTLSSTTAGPITVYNAPASQLVISPAADEPPSAVTAGASFGLTVTAEDQYGNVATGNVATKYSGDVSVSLVGTGFLTGASLPVPVVNGQAVITGLAIDTAGTFQLLVTANPALTSVTSTSIVVSPASPDLLVWTTQPVEPPPPLLPQGTVIHNFQFGAALAIEDQYHNIEKNLIGTVSLALNPNPENANLEGDTSADLLNGIATFSQLSINELTPPGMSYTLQATSTLPATSSYPLTSLTSAASIPLTVIPTPASSLEITTQQQPPSSVTVYSPFSFAVTALDQFGNPDSDFTGPVTVELEQMGVPTNQLMPTTMVTVDAVGGVATFTGLSVGIVGGGYSLAVSSPALTGATSNTFSVVAGPATQLVISPAADEPPPSVQAGSQFGFVVTAEDYYGNLATSFTGPDATVSIRVLHGPSGGTLTGATGATAVNGVATITGLILTTATTPSSGGYLLQVSSADLAPPPPGTTPPPLPTTSPITVTPLAASKFVFSTPSSEPPPSVTAGSPFQLTITAEDKYGNTATSYGQDGQEVAIALSRNPGMGSLMGTLIEPASSGVATFSGLTLDTVGSPYTIAASNGSLTSPPSTPIAVVPAAAATLEVSTPPPSTMVSGSQFGLNIAALDPFGNLATGYTGLVQIELLNNPGMATLSGPDVMDGKITVSAVAGVAYFTAEITTEVAASGYTLQATAVNALGVPLKIPGPPVTTPGITVTPAPATHLELVPEPPAPPGPPSLVTPGATFGFEVAAEDQYNNIATTYTGPITVSVPAGSGAVLGGTTSLMPTNNPGEVTFNDLTLTESNGPVSLTVTGAGLSGSITTNPVAVTTPAQVSFATGSVTVNESAGSATIEVVRSGGYTGAISVKVATSGGTAVPGVNYAAISTVLTFAAGQDSETVTIPVMSTSSLSSSVTVNVGLSNPGTYTTLGSQPTATVVIEPANVAPPPPPPPPLVTVDSVQTVTKKHLITEILVGFSGAVNATEAQATSTYQLIMANSAGLFVPTKKTLVKIKSASYANDAVTLKLKTPLKLKKSVELIVDGVAPNGLQDSYGRLIDGADNGQSGSNAVSVISKSGVKIDAVPGGPMAVKVAAARRKK